MIIEGSHKVLGKGIYISDIQKNSLAFKVWLKLDSKMISVYLMLNCGRALLYWVTNLKSGLVFGHHRNAPQ